MRTYLKVMKAAADATRVKILKMLQHRQLCVCEMQSVLGISQPAVSRHLRILEEADLIRGEKDGMWNNFRLTRAAERNEFAHAILEHLQGWLEEDPEVQETLKRALVVDRDNLGTEAEMVNLTEGAPASR